MLLEISQKNSQIITNKQNNPNSNKEQSLLEIRARAPGNEQSLSPRHPPEEQKQKKIGFEWYSLLW